MEQKQTTKTNAPRKMKFAPKAPTRRAPKLEVKTYISFGTWNCNASRLFHCFETDLLICMLCGCFRVGFSESAEDTDAAQARDLLERLNQISAKTKPKFERKESRVINALNRPRINENISTVTIAFGLKPRFMSYFNMPAASSQVAFGFGAASASSSMKIFGGISKGKVPTSGLREEKEYKEPWDYYSYYPLTLPMRRPYSGNPEFLDEEEFASANIAFDESSVEPAVDLGLLEENPEATMFFMQLPPTLPMTKQTGNTSGKRSIPVQSQLLLQVRIADFPKML
ncbi:putative Cytochrome P450 [Hibiscus syriacus]|uniref:Cytochrome P450 n=1 Tax=Hibiscus syriacus TaxID=106335 RepID=A0A6A2YTC5_HIBSY|nr:putative Cytochrome P450 [Hibiscus syriacus]